MSANNNLIRFCTLCETKIFRNSKKKYISKLHKTFNVFYLNLNNK